MQYGLDNIGILIYDDDILQSYSNQEHGADIKTNTWPWNRIESPE